ncbi:MAG TPA: pantoate--beta-alanine ligase [Jatrophihabitans sp.]|jgi:pantoate--beta-alanine ligase
MTRLVHSRADFYAARDALAAPIGLVTTMGALHDGHLALIEAARGFSESVIVTIFVNPMQFGANEDLAKYPRTLEADVARCAEAGVDLVWVPLSEDVYPGGPVQVSVDPGPLGRELEGEFRPTHFAGVLTVVAKFFGLVRPAAAFFGEKDYQQLALIRQMAADLDLGLAVAGVPTVREPDGLALSSRNVFLSPEEHAKALVLSQALLAGAAAASGGAAAVLTAGRTVLATEPDVKVDYFELRGADLGPAPERGVARLLIAARVGTTRLIDNIAVDL